MDTCEKGAKCLIGRIWTDKKINKESFWTTLSRLWRTTDIISFKEIQDNLWIFEFSDEGEKERVMEGWPWSYERQIMVLNDFDGQVPPSLMEFHQTPCWIQVHDMPLHCMSRAVGTKIGESLGVLEEVDVAGDGIGWGRYLRLRVRINIRKPLERGRNLLIGGKTVWVSFKYENLPTFCFHCGCILHGAKGYLVKSTGRMHNEEGTVGWGVRLRAEDPRRKTEGKPFRGGGDGQAASVQGGQSSDGEIQRDSSTEVERSTTKGNPSDSSTPKKASNNSAFNSPNINAEYAPPRAKSTHVEKEGARAAGLMAKEGEGMKSFMENGNFPNDSPTSLRKVKIIARGGSRPIIERGPKGEELEVKRDGPIIQGLLAENNGGQGSKRKRRTSSDMEDIQRDAGPKKGSYSKVIQQTWAKKTHNHQEKKKKSQYEEIHSPVLSDKAEAAEQPRG